MASEELQRAQANAVAAAEKLERAQASRAAADAMVLTMHSELEHAYGEVMASDADAEREEALAEEHFRTLIGRVLDAILDVAIEEVAAVEAVALATQAAAAEAAALAEEAVLAEEHWLRTRYLEEPRLLLTFDAEDASVVCEAATAQPPRGTSAGRTLLHDVLGSVNVRRIRFTEDPSVGVDRRKKREQRVLKNGVLIGERRFQVFAYKEDDEGTYVFIAEHGRSWHPFLGVVTWRSVSEARQLFANFESVPSLPKYTMRPGLLLSKTFDLRTVLEERLAIRRVVVHSHPVETLPLPVQLSAPPPGTLQVIELADVRSGAGHLMTDGGGMVSADVADQIPLITRRSHCPLSEARDSPRSGPMVTQMRLWYHGAVAKGTLLRDATLPERTVVLRRSMIKVEARGSKHFWAFEVVATSKAAREARTSKLLVSLLESIGGEAMGRALMSLAHAHLTKLLECTKPPLPLHMLSKLAEHDLNDIEHSEADGDLEPVTSTLGILNAGFEPMREPYLHQKLSQIVASQLKKVREGSFPIPQSVFAFGVPDPTGTLEPGTCCLVTEGVFYMDQPSALLYRHPGLHPGSVRRVRVVSPPSALRRALEGVDPLRATAIIFSTRGERSLADEMDGGDMDGDEFALIWNETMLEAFPRESLPAWSEAEQQMLLGGIQRGAQLTPLQEEPRRDAAAWHLVRTRYAQATKGRFANQWLLVAEACTTMAKDRRAVTLAYGYAISLDMSKMGSASLAIPDDCQLSAYPSHLAAHFPHRKDLALFTSIRDTTLAKLHALDTACSLPACEVPDDCFHLAHPRYVAGGQPTAQFSELLDKWEARYKQCKAELKTLPDTDWNDPDRAKLRALNGIFETYRELLLEGYSEYEVRYPEADSELLAEVAAVYAVNHKQYFQGQREGWTQKGWRIPSLKFAWHIGGDYFNLIKWRQLAEPRPGARRGAAPVCDPRSATALLAANHRAWQSSPLQPALRQI